MMGTYGWGIWGHTVERLGFGKEPVKPTSIEFHLVEFFESTLVVYLGVVGELSTFNETEDDCVFEPSQD